MGCGMEDGIAWKRGTADAQCDAAAGDLSVADDTGCLGPISRVFVAQKAAAEKDRYPSYRVRRDRLDKLARLVNENRGALIHALHGDFGCRSEQETLMSEILASLNSIRYLRSRLSKLMKPQKRSVSMWYLPGSAVVERQPLGVVGIMSPWNYPVHLSLAPAVAALAAGNRVMLKMSELTPHTSGLLRTLVSKAFEETEFTVVEGDALVSKHFAGLPFDHLLFTGSTQVGRQVAAAAARNLTPVTLELSGKGPVVVAEDYDVLEAARRVAWGKIFNAGQTCVAPDYAFVPAAKVDEFCRELVAAWEGFAADQRPDRQATHIINAAHYARLTGLVEDARAKGAMTMSAANARVTTDPSNRRFPPTVIVNPTSEMRIYSEEIFGPVLMVFGYDTLDDAISAIQKFEDPLALYVFSHKSDSIRKVLAGTRSGGVTVNDTLLHYNQDSLPFGGVGTSGMGRYHGIEGFETFSNKRAVFRQRGFGRFTGLKLLYPPYGRLSNFMIKLMMSI